MEKKLCPCGQAAFAIGNIPVDIIKGEFVMGSVPLCFVHAQQAKNLGYEIKLIGEDDERENSGSQNGNRRDL
jgi:hypothetical protein